MRALLLAPILLIASPASAQIWDGGADATASRVSISPRYGPRIDRVRDEISDARDAGQITRTDARRLRREASQIGNLASRFGRDGISDAEAAELQVREQLLRDDLNAKRSGFRK